MSSHTCIMVNIITKILPCSTIVLDVKSYLSCNIIKWLQRHKSKTNMRFRWCTHQISRSQKSSKVNHCTFSKCCCFLRWKEEKKHLQFTARNTCISGEPTADHAPILSTQYPCVKWQGHSRSHELFISQFERW